MDWNDKFGMKWTRQFETSSTLRTINKTLNHCWRLDSLFVAEKFWITADISTHFLWGKKKSLNHCWRHHSLSVAEKFWITDDVTIHFLRQKTVLITVDIWLAFCSRKSLNHCWRHDPISVVENNLNHCWRHDSLSAAEKWEEMKPNETGTQKWKTQNSWQQTKHTKLYSNLIHA